MKHLSFLPLIMLAATLQMSLGLFAQETQAPAPLKPADCLVDAKSAAASLVYEGKTYYFKDEVCKTEFLAEPERYSQLYDALLELKAAGKPVQKPKPLDNASLVPS